MAVEAWLVYGLTRLLQRSAKSRARPTVRAGCDQAFGLLPSDVLAGQRGDSTEGDEND